MTPTLFLPGTLCDERLWLPTWQLMPQLQRRYVPLQWANTIDDMLHLTSDRILDGEKVNVVGFSLGGHIAALWATQNPDKVASLVLLNYSPFGLDKSEIQRRKSLVSAINKKQYRADADHAIKPYFHPQNQSNTSLVNLVKEMASDLGSSTLLAQIQATTPREATIDKLRKLSCPVHFVGGDKDHLVPTEILERSHQNIPNSRVKIFADSGHMTPLEQTSALVSYLSESLA